MAEATENTVDVFVARHPIFDVKESVIAYELAFREGFEEMYERLGAEKSTLDLMAMVNFGELTNCRRGLIHLTPTLLSRDFHEALPNEMVIVGVPEINRDPVPQSFIEECQALKKAGYVLLMTEGVLTDRTGRLLEFADMVRVNFAGLSRELRRKCAAVLKRRNVTAMAGNVCGRDEFREAKEWGYTLFQGDFFCRPEPKAAKDIPANKLTYLQVLHEVNQPELSYDDIENLLKQDVSMSYKLLQFLNSAWFGLRYQVNSIKHALVLLGPKEIKQWVSVLVVKDMAEEKPEELLAVSLTRAKAAESLAPHVELAEQRSQVFLMGMFSCIDALMDMPMDRVLEELPLEEDIKTALTGGPNAFRHLLDAICAYEKGDWGQLSLAASELNLDESLMPQILRESTKWAHEALGVF